MRKFIAGLLAATLSALALGATTTPIQLLNPAGSTAGQAIVSNGPSSAPGWVDVANGISQSTTLNVPSQYATIQAALNSLASKTIASGATVTIQIADGTYSVSPLTIAHQSGANIRIIGNCTTPANVTLNFAGTNGFYVPRAYSLGELNCVQVKNTGAKGTTAGVFTDGGNIAKFGPKAIIDGFYYGLAARWGGVINANGTVGDGITVKNGGDVNIWAYQGGQISAQYATAQGAIDAGNNWGLGILAEFGGVVDATNATATGNYLGGIAAYSGGSVRAHNSAVSGNGGATPSPVGYSAGYIARGGSSMEVHSGSTTGNITNAYGYSYDPASLIDGVSTITNSGNALGAFFVPNQYQPGATYQFNNGTITVNGAIAGNVTGGDAYVDQNVAATRFGIRRFLNNGVESWRQQWSTNSGNYTWSIVGGGTGLTYASTTGATTLSALTVTNALTPSQTAGLVGTTTNNNANAGAWGEYSEQINTGVAMITGVSTNVTSLSLGAGDWYVFGNAVCTAGPSDTITNLASGLSTTTGVLPVTVSNRSLSGTISVPTGTAASTQPPALRFSFSGTTIVYLVANIAHSGGTATCEGRISAWRRR